MIRVLFSVVGLVFVSALSAAEPWKAVMLSPESATTQAIAEIVKSDVKAIALRVERGDFSQLIDGAKRVQESGLELQYWFEIGRDERLATDHPEWMASIQGHQEWRRFFSDLEKERDDQVVKVFPWVPIAYQESFAAHLDRVRDAMGALPQATTIWLNNLQGPPSVCGCGHTLCRWTTDYGPKQTATSMGNDAAAKFVTAVRSFAGDSQVVPVWATECEQHDQDVLCGGVGCYEGRCWKDWTKQLMPLSEVTPTIGVLATYKALGRDLENYGTEAGWVREAIGSFQTMPRLRSGKPVPANRLVAVVQGWDVSAAELNAQVAHAGAAGVKGILIAREPINQSWEPRMVPFAR